MMIVHHDTLMILTANKIVFLSLSGSRGPHEGLGFFLFFWRLQETKERERESAIFKLQSKNKPDAQRQEMVIGTLALLMIVAVM